MKFIKLGEPKEPHAYVVLGIDEHEHDQVLSVHATYEGARAFCISCTFKTEYYDLWIEKHPILNP